jgi:signal transduction histidine kinase
VYADFEQFVMVLTHILKNAQDATPPDGEIEVQVKRDEDCMKIVIKDTGCGMSEEFVRNRLFKPFDSTKGSQGMGVGVYQAREFTRDIGGELRVSSAPGVGTEMTLVIPVSRGAK